MPDDVDDATAVALTTGTGYLTAYLALTRLAGFRAGQSVLAPGAGGAVGQGGVEVARMLGASCAITTATTPDRAAQGRDAGYEVIDLSAESLADGVARLTGGEGVDVVLDGIGGPVTGPSLEALAVDGTLVSIGYAGGMQATIAVTDLIWKNAHVHGFRYAPYSAEEVNAGNALLLDKVSEGVLSPKVAQVLSLEQAALAARHLADDSPFGRVLLTIGRPA